MKKILPVLFAFCVLLPRLLYAAQPRFSFASVEEGRSVLTTRDEFINRLSPFDRSARLKTGRPVAEAELLDFIGASVRAWGEAERRDMADAAMAVRSRIDAFSLPLPATVSFVITSGEEDGGAPYTRGEAIIIPQPWLAANKKVLPRMVCHELFHILTRRNPGLRERLYGIIGFRKVGELSLPVDLARRKMTNPDAPLNDHAIRVKLRGRKVWTVPMLLARAEAYEEARGGNFFDYLTFRLLPVQISGDPPVAVPLPDGPVEMAQVSGYEEQVGRNTRYLIHPEEILAENFVLLVMGSGKVPSPGILAKMREVLTRP